jgi:high-affinity nickel-transport protein
VKEPVVISVSTSSRIFGLHRLRAFQHALTGAEWARLGGMFAVIAGLNFVGWFVVGVLVAPHHYQLGTKVFGVGLGLTAYTLGMRHAFDVDHIAAIDNTTRKLMSEGKRPLSVGYWFSLGHSSIVFALALLLSVGVKAIVGPIKDDGSSLHHYTGLIGTSISGGFLYLIAVVNIVILVGVLKVFREMRRGTYDEAALEEQLQNRGFMNRILGPMLRSVTKPWQMYPIVILFGLGFDTATEVALLVIASSSAAAGLPWYAILSLPVLFAAGMSLFDTLDGTFMNFAYGWAFSKPVRKVYYNITVTGLSVAVALIIGSIELLGLLSEQLDLSGSFWTGMQNANLNTLGFVVVGLFTGTWAIAFGVWKFCHIEEKWNAGLLPEDGSLGSAE